MTQYRELASEGRQRYIYCTQKLLNIYREKKKISLWNPGTAVKVDTASNSGPPALKAE
jgi:hypothetical protein